jgi:hypothetical protein
MGPHEGVGRFEARLGRATANLSCRTFDVAVATAPEVDALLRATKVDGIVGTDLMALCGKTRVPVRTPDRPARFDFAVANAGGTPVSVLLQRRRILRGGAPLHGRHRTIVHRDWRP